MSEVTHKINHKIRARQVRLVGDNVENGVYSRDEALRLAEDMNLDLVEISPNAEPPVCRVIEYSKFKYEQKKRQKEMKAKAAKVVLKEIRFTPNTDDHDLDFKSKHAIKFLQEGNKVKAYVHFQGRAIMYKERGEHMLNYFLDRVGEYGKVEQGLRLEGKRMFLILAPRVVAPAPTAKKGEQKEEE